MKAIVNVNKNWAIGRENGLLVYIPEDMKFFRSTTAGKTLVMGRKTLESFPGKRPLKGRINIVLTRDMSRIPAEAFAAADVRIDGNAPDAAILYHDALTEQKEGNSGQTVLIVLSSASKLNMVFAVPRRMLADVTDNVYVIGGESVYRELLPYCDTCLVTVNDFIPPDDSPADAWFPDLDQDPDWELAEEGEMKEFEGIHYRFCTYRKTDPKDGAV